MDDIHTREWGTVFEPLLEALKQMNDLGRADAIVNTLRELQQQGHLGEALLQRAIALANGCGRLDFARRWSVFLSAKDTVEQWSSNESQHVYQITQSPCNLSCPSISYRLSHYRHNHVYWQQRPR